MNAPGALGADPPDPDAFAILGAGRVGLSLAVLLQRAGFTVAACTARSGAALDRAVQLLRCPGYTDPVAAAGGAGTVLLCVPDGVVASLASRLAAAGVCRPGMHVVHTAGVFGVEPLAPAAGAGAAVLAIHPLQAVPDVATGVKRLPGSWFGITCDDAHWPWAERLVSALGGHPLRVPASERVRYHAGAVMSSNFLVTLAALVGEVAGGVEPYLPLLRGTLENLQGQGAAAALTGPVVRGETGTIRAHVAALAGTPAGDAYVQLTAQTIRTAQASGRIDAATASALWDALWAAP
ncbi:MAG: Rossmann-like and DUF2520 domain-containing protein [Actinomycetota bacterium]